MTIHLKYFGSLADQIGTREATCDLPEGATLAVAMATLAAEHPAIAAMRDKLAIAVNFEYQQGGHVLCDQDEVALIPPVSGG